MTMEATTLSIAVARDRRDLYEAIWRPETFTRWAAGLGKSLSHEGNRWVAQGPEGPVTVRFSPHNAFGVMDHWVELGDGHEVYVPLRIVANGDGAEVMLTLFRQRDMSTEKFAGDQASVRRDLEALKRLAETTVEPSGDRRR